MTTEYLLMLVARWLHIVAAALAVGVPLYVRFVELPAMATLPESERLRFRYALAKRWRIIGTTSASSGQPPCPVRPPAPRCQIARRGGLTLDATGAYDDFECAARGPECGRAWI